MSALHSDISVFLFGRNIKKSDRRSSRFNFLYNLCQRVITKMCDNLVISLRTLSSVHSVFPAGVRRDPLRTYSYL